VTQLSRHGRLAQQYWQTYRPQALQELGPPERQQEFFHALDLRVTEKIGTLTQELLQQVPAGQRAAAPASGPSPAAGLSAFALRPVDQARWQGQSR
jgi:hypothetical protein